jgi:hypothetical protein
MDASDVIQAQSETEQAESELIQTQIEPIPDPFEPSFGASFDQFIQAGKAAYAAGEKRRAHELWREAATIDPYQEKVWVALLRVLESDDDRRVCLENILAINPGNQKARRHLNRINEAEARAARTKRKFKLPRLILFLLYVVRGIFIGLIAALIGTAMSILIYGFVR